MQLSFRDIIFGAINGAFIGILAPFIFKNLGANLPVPVSVFIPTMAIGAGLGIAVGYYLSKIRPFFFQLAKFGLIGVANTVVDLGIYNFFIFMSDTSSGYLIIVFKFFSVSMAIINSYIWNKFWSFENKGTQNLKQEFSQFLMVSLVGMLLNVGITAFVVNIIGAPAGVAEKTWANIGALTASALVLTWNFIGYKFFVFKK
ncbi:MAG: GtrA family protein [Candidatus Moranbacteria bacterium]|jgi:putative flippase GtrA|nr:GtrA family protein [Candidatus Moranbacteria bacterium]